MAAKERPAEFAILGLLATDEAGSHGYDLARSFAPGEPLGEILRLEPGMLYHHLKQLERSVSVKQTTVQAGNRPPRQIYQITEHGLARLRKWMQSPVGHTREIRLDFLVKLYFAQKLDSDLAASLVTTQLTILRDVRASMQQAAEAPPTGADTTATQFLESVRTLRLAQTDAAIHWLESKQSDAERVVSQKTTSDMP